MHIRITKHRCCQTSGTSTASELYHGAGGVVIVTMNNILEARNTSHRRSRFQAHWSVAR